MARSREQWSGVTAQRDEPAPSVDNIRPRADRRVPRRARGARSVHALTQPAGCAQACAERSRVNTRAIFGFAMFAAVVSAAVATSHSPAFLWAGRPVQGLLGGDYLHELSGAELQNTVAGLVSGGAAQPLVTAPTSLAPEVLAVFLHDELATEDVRTHGTDAFPVLQKLMADSPASLSVPFTTRTASLRCLVHRTPSTPAPRPGVPRCVSLPRTALHCWDPLAHLSPATEQPAPARPAIAMLDPLRCDGSFEGATRVAADQAERYLEQHPALATNGKTDVLLIPLPASVQPGKRATAFLEHDALVGRVAAVRLLTRPPTPIPDLAPSLPLPLTLLLTLTLTLTPTPTLIPPSPLTPTLAPDPNPRP